MSSSTNSLTRVALVTGTGAGIGRGVALAFARAGYDLLLCDINAEALNETSRLVAGLGRQSYVEVVDLRDAEVIHGFVDRAAARFGRLDVLVNNAGVMHIHRVDDVTVTLVDDLLAVNLRSAILFSKYAVPHLRKIGGGVILHMGSVHAHNGHAGASVYAATKGALLALARSQAVELAPDNIRVNTVSPGTVDSPMLHRFLETHAENREQALAAFSALHPRGKLATIDEVARCFVFLASDDAANVTGADLRCDGGFCIQGFQPRS